MPACSCVSLYDLGQLILTKIGLMLRGGMTAPLTTIRGSENPVSLCCHYYQPH